MPYKINPFTGNPDYYDASTGGTVTSVASGTGLTGGPITTTGTLSVDSATVPYYAGGPGSAGFVKWNGTAWAIDTTGYVNKAGDSMTGYLTLNADPTSSLHAATKQYVDNIATRINFHAPVVAATTVPLPAVTYSNGTGGVSATLIATSPGALTIDTINFLGGGTERVLIKDQVSGLENGIYVVNIVGDALTPFQLTRATDADNSPAGELAFGDFCFVEQGPTNGGFGYILNTIGTITVGVTSISYVIFNAAQVVTAGTGLTEAPTNTLNIDIIRVPYYSIGFSAGFAKYDGSNWIFDNSTYLDTTTAASTYLTQANAVLQYYPLSSNPAGYITSGSLSGYVPYTGATTNLNLGAFQLTTSQVNISTAGALTTTAGVLKLEAAAATNLILNTPNITSGASTKIQFGGVDVLELKGPSSTTTITNFIYTNPDNTNQVGPVSSMIIDPGTRTWTGAGVPNNFGDTQKEIEILSPTYLDTSIFPLIWDGDAFTFYVNPPNTGTPGVGYALGIKGHFRIDGDLSDYPLGTYLDIGNGVGTMIGFNGAKLSFFGDPPVSKQGPVTTVQGLATALNNLGLILPSTLSFGTTGSVLFAGASGALSQDNASFFWDDTNNRLGIGNNTPTEALTVTGNMLLNLTGSTSVKIYNFSSINTYESAGPTLISSTGSNYLNIRAGGDFGIQTNGSTTNKLSIKLDNSNGNSQTQFTSTLFGQSGCLATTEVRSVLFSGASKTWQNGNIATQRWFHITANTAAFASAASTITNSYGLYVEEAIAGTNATITNNYALGVKGQIGFDWTSVGNPTMRIGSWLSPPSSSFPTYGWGIVTSNELFRIPSTIYFGDTNFVIKKQGTLSAIIEPFDNLTLRSINTASGGQKTYLFGNQATGNVSIGSITATERLTISGGNILLEDAGNFIVGTTTGTKFGTSTSQRLGFFNATPIVQPTAVTTVQGLADALGSATGLGLIATSVITLPVVIQAACSDETSNLTTGIAKVTFRMPHAMTLTAIRASLTTGQASGTLVTVDVNLNGVSILGTKLTFNNTQTTTTTATTPATIVTSALTDDGEITVDIDAIGAAGAKGLKITLIGTRV